MICGGRPKHSEGGERPVDLVKKEDQSMGWQRKDFSLATQVHSSHSVVVSWV